MCGICGYIGSGKPATLEAMTLALSHRGPDSSGIHADENLGLGHRRLAVIDLRGGAQPMHSENGDVLVYNGEIYNFREIRTELENLGRRFFTDSDTEVVLEAYRQWGEACLERFRGMFAFALWDAGRRKLFLARDRLGIKPLYYSEKGGVFYFASEAKALLEIPGYERKLNRRALPLYLSFRYTPGDATLFSGIKKLPPGHLMTVSVGRSPQLRRYWRLRFEPDEGLGEKAWRERFWEVFSEAVRLRLVSDVPLGAYLSGGLDSSLIVAAMSEFSATPVEAFSVGFNDAHFDEVPYARTVAEQFGCRHHILLAEEGAANVLPRVIHQLDEPLGDLAAIPTYLMARATKPHATVVLSGEGADELLGGYPKYRAFLLGRQAAPFLPPGICGTVARLARNISVQRLLGSLAERDHPRAYLELAAVFNPAEMTALLRPEVRQAGISEGEIVGSLRPFFSRNRDRLSQMLDLDIHTWLPDDLLLKNDRMTMAHGVEARVPYLDHKLVELCARLPSCYKLSWFREKLLLRKVMAGRLPKTVCRRKKAGFSVPLAQWMDGPMGETVKAVFCDEFMTEQRLFRAAYLKELMQRPLNHPYYRRQFWTVAALGLWQRHFQVESS